MDTTGSYLTKRLLYLIHAYLIEPRCAFEPVLDTECPTNPNVNECRSNMNHGELCEADKTLPDGNSNYNINNCGNYDVFKCVKGNHSILH